MSASRLKTFVFDSFATRHVSLIIDSFLLNYFNPLDHFFDDDIINPVQMSVCLCTCLFIFFRPTLTKLVMWVNVLCTPFQNLSPIQSSGYAIVCVKVSDSAISKMNLLLRYSVECVFWFLWSQLPGTILHTYKYSNICAGKWHLTSFEWWLTFHAALS